MDTESQASPSVHKKESHRCPRCHKFFGPRDAVCGDCGTANLHFINGRAKVLAARPDSCHHYYVHSELGDVCVVCSHIRMSAETSSPRLSTRTDHICSCCGSQIHGTDYCTTCGARVTYFSLRPEYQDQAAFRYMTQHANYIEQRDPNYRFKIHSPVSHRIWLFALLFIAIEIAIIGPVGVASFYVSQRTVNETSSKVEQTRAGIADLSGFYAGGMDPDSIVLQVGHSPVAGRLLAECKGEASALLYGTAGVAWLPGQEDVVTLQRFVSYGGYSTLDYFNHDLYVLVVTPPTLKVLRGMQEELPVLEAELARVESNRLWKTLKPFIYTLPEAIAFGVVLLFLVLRSAMRRRADFLQQKQAPIQTVAASRGTTAQDSPSSSPASNEPSAAATARAPVDQAATLRREKVRHWWQDSKFLRIAIGLLLLVLAETVVVGITYLFWYFKNGATSLDFIWRLGPAGGTALWTFYIITALVAVVTLLVWIEFLDRLDFQRRREDWVKSAHRYRFDSTLENDGF
jgi:predicted amidophosphoribosyltransferase